MREIDYSQYFWLDDKVRLRAMREEDWEDHYYNRFDTPARNQSCSHFAELCLLRAQAQ
ncbi:hypothetical protein [Paenibacillus sp. FSL R5-0519]|uniref:hypothetical protein n=1 Tax=Paenibacillus sp. FSL R5-0519 TaxID=2921648 RepID=UPI0030DACEC3